MQRVIRCKCGMPDCENHLILGHTVYCGWIMAMIRGQEDLMYVSKTELVRLIVAATKILVILTRNSLYDKVYSFWRFG